MRNLVASVILYEKVKTTRARAEAARPLLERAITIGKKGTLQARRQLHQFFYTEQPIKKIFEVLAPKYQARTGGYTRITKLGQRSGDAAPIVQIELV